MSRLRLNRETLRQLDTPSALNAVGAGTQFVGCYSQHCPTNICPTNVGCPSSFCPPPKSQQLFCVTVGCPTGLF